MLARMPRSPLRDGWRVLKRAPATILTEIAWRWTFGLAFCATLYYGFREYFASVEITNAEYAAMRSLQPYTWIAILGRVMVAFIEGLHLIGPIMIPALVILWVALSTIGRAATIRALSAVDSRTNWPATAALNLFRLILVAAAILAYFGCGALIDAMVGDTTQHLAAVVLLAALAMIVIATVWGMLNWFLSLAPIFTIRDGTGLFASITQAVDVYRVRSRAFTASGFSFGFIRTVLVIIATILSLLPIAQFSGTHVRLTILIVVTTSLAYFALADALNIWRLAAYISFTEPDPAPPVVVMPDPVPTILVPPDPPLTPVPPDSPGQGFNNQ